MLLEGVTPTSVIRGLEFCWRFHRTPPRPRQVACERPDTDPCTHFGALTTSGEKSNLGVVVTQLQLEEQRRNQRCTAVTSAASNALAAVS